MRNSLLSGKRRSFRDRTRKKRSYRKRWFLKKRRRCKTVGRDPRELPLAMYAVEHMWPTLSEELGVDVEYHKEGNLRLGKTAKHKEILQGLTDRAVALGLDVRMIDGKEVREINPYLSDEITVASWCPTDGHANPLVATLGFYKRARELGAEFITGEMCSRSRRSKEKPDVW